MDNLTIIEGSGDTFTVYTAFRSVQENPGGGNCEITKVNIFSGTRRPDGSLSDLHVGCGIVGLVGFCNPLRIDQAQISRLAGNLIGEACSEAPQGPADGDKVQLVIENFLLDQVNIYTDPDPNAQASANVDPLGTVAIEIDPGFTLDFESARPSAGLDQNGDDILMGEVVAREAGGVAFEASGSRRVSGKLEVFGGEYYDGWRLGFISRVQWEPVRHLLFALSYSHSRYWDLLQLAPSSLSLRRHLWWVAATIWTMRETSTCKTASSVPTLNPKP